MNPETKIQAQIIEFCHKKHIPVWRVSDTKNMVGFPDLLLIDPRNGKFVGVEVKTPTGRTSRIQELVHSIIKDAKAEVIVARSLSDVVVYFDDKPN